MQSSMPLLSPVCANKSHDIETRRSQQTLFYKTHFGGAFSSQKAI